MTRISIIRGDITRLDSTDLVPYTPSETSGEGEILYSYYLNRLDNAKLDAIKTTTFVIPQTGGSVCQMQIAVRAAYYAIIDFLKLNPGVLDEIILVLTDNHDHYLFTQAFMHNAPKLELGTVASFSILTPEAADAVESHLWEQMDNDASKHTILCSDNLPARSWCS
jgi:O-acetyl-ADP-ribose deacetylase (regulator of RNase III)